MRKARQSPRRSSWLLLSAAAIPALLGAACGGRIRADDGNRGSPSGVGSEVASSVASSASTASGSGSSVTSLPPPSSGSTVIAPAGDPGTVGMHRLNAFEYDNTINDLLGLQQNVAETTFIADEVGTNGFDNEADVLTMSPAEMQQYATAAKALGEQVFASPTLASRIVTCTPPSTADTTCLDAIIDNFGFRAFRRPLSADEGSQFRAVAMDALASGQDFTGAVNKSSSRC